MTSAVTAAPRTEGDFSSLDLDAPLYLAWQLTNDCNLACLHCIEESGPGKAFKDEMSKEQIFSILEQVVAAEIPYLSFSGGEPMIHPHFWEMAEFVCSNGVNLKVETNAHLITPEAAERLARIGIKSCQVSLDGGQASSYEQLRIHGRWDKVLAGLANLKRAGVAVEVNFSPTSANADEIGQAVDLAFEVGGATKFYTGRTMYTGNAVKAWRLIEPREEQYTRFFATLDDKIKQYGDRLCIRYHAMGLVEELRYRLQHPAALFIVLPNGLVKLINALPFVCGDLRTQSIHEVWENFGTAWKDPRVSSFVEEMALDPKLTSVLHNWVTL